MKQARDLLQQTAELAAQYLESLGERPVFPRVEPEQLREALGGPLPEEPIEPERVVRDLVAAAEPGVVAEGSGRYFVDSDERTDECCAACRRAGASG